MIESYEERRSHLWKDAYKNAKEFSYDNTPTAKVISFFCPRKDSDPEINLNVKEGLQSENNDDTIYDKVVNLSWAIERLNKTLQYKRKFYGDKDIYSFVALQNYLDQCKAGGYTKCLLSWQEVYMIKEKAKKT